MRIIHRFAETAAILSIISGVSFAKGNDMNKPEVRQPATEFSHAATYLRDRIDQPGARRLLRIFISSDKFNPTNLRGTAASDYRFLRFPSLMIEIDPDNLKEVAIATEYPTADAGPVSASGQPANAYIKDLKLTEREASFRLSYAFSDLSESKYAVRDARYIAPMFIEPSIIKTLEGSELGASPQLAVLAQLQKGAGDFAAFRRGFSTEQNRWLTHLLQSVDEKRLMSQMDFSTLIAKAPGYGKLYVGKDFADLILTDPVGAKMRVSFILEDGVWKVW